MLRFVKYSILVFLAIVCQTTLFPALLAEPFRPALLVLLVVHLGLNESNRWVLVAFLLGLVQDSFSGVYFGLHGFSFLLVFVLLRLVSGRLFTDSRTLMTVAVFLASLVVGISSLILMLLFANGSLYGPLLTNLVPQALVNGLAASVLFSCDFFRRVGEVP